MPSKLRWTWFLPLALMAFISCSSDGTTPGDEVPPDETPPDGDCVPTDKYFSKEVWGPILSTNCISCHTAQGEARDSKFVLIPDTQTGYLDANLKTIEQVSAYEVGGTSILLLKPTEQIDHGGGKRIEIDGPEYVALSGLVDRFRNPVACEGQEDLTYFEGVVLLDYEATLRKVALNLVGRLPTAEEIALVKEGGEPQLRATITAMMTEEAFYNRLVEVYNDWLLTDRYYDSSNAINLLDGNDYPDRNYYDVVTDGDTRNQIRDNTNHAIAREPLNLISYVVKNDRPFTEILTADYVLVNAYSARTYGITQYAFSDGADPNAINPNLLHEARITMPDGTGIPHAGLLTSHVFLNRFPTTATNRNRHRSRMTQLFFLATDVLKLADRPVDPSAIIGFNPTMNDPNCAVCHAVVDPIAGTYQNWDDRGRYRPPEAGWFGDMRPPGFADGDMPYDQRFESLRWLAKQITQDPRFVTATVQQAFYLLTGQTPMTPPTSSDEQRLRAYEAQTDLFSKIGQAFVDSNYNFKTIVLELAMSPYFRAANVQGTPDELRAIELENIGTGRLLTPEQLDRKIQAVTGYRWMRYGTRPILTTENEFEMFYGGIDSDSVTTRVTEPNGIMANIQMRMANEMSCLAVPRDFALEPGQRKLFPNVERTFGPEDENGFEIPAAVESIKENIRYLHLQLLGERLVPGDPEIDRTYQLFLDTWHEGRDLVQNDTLSANLDYNCRAESEEIPMERQFRDDPEYLVRAWMAVVTYLMADWHFLYE